MECTVCLCTWSKSIYSDSEKHFSVMLFSAACLSAALYKYTTYNFDDVVVVGTYFVLCCFVFSVGVYVCTFYVHKSVFALYSPNANDIFKGNFFFLSLPSLTRSLYLTDLYAMRILYIYRRTYYCIPHILFCLSFLLFGLCRINKRQQNSTVYYFRRCGVAYVWTRLFLLLLLLSFLIPRCAHIFKSFINYSESHRAGDDEPFMACFLFALHLIKEANDVNRQPKQKKEFANKKKINR